MLSEGANCCQIVFTVVGNVDFCQWASPVVRGRGLLSSDVDCCQGALAGGWIGLAFNMVVILGDWITEPHREHLPTNVENCPNGTEINPPPQDPYD